MASYEIEFTETSTHKVTLSAEELADLLGVSVESLPDDPGDIVGLEDALGNLDDDGWEGTEREIDQILCDE